MAVVALGLGILAGWGVRLAHGECEDTCSAQGPCPTPADCLDQPFNWTAAVMLGAVVTLIVVAVGLAVQSHARHD